MKEFNDGTLDPQKRAAMRLGDVYEVAHRIERLGIREVRVTPEELKVSFRDQRFDIDAHLEIEPWFNGEAGWYWREWLGMFDGSISGPMGRRRWILAEPYPREVVRMYQDEIHWYRRSHNKRSKRA